MQTSIAAFARVLLAEARSSGEALRSRYLGVLLLTVLVLLGVAAQVPQHYRFDVGYEEGFGSDLPFVSDFYPFEPEDQSAPLNWRWTSGESFVAFPGFGQRPIKVALHILPINPEIQARGAQTAQIWSKGAHIATVPVKPAGAVYHLLLPPETGFGDQQGFEIRSATVAPTGDAREVGVPVDEVVLSVPSGPALPHWGTVLPWLVATVLGWLGVRRSGFRPRAAFVLLSVWAMLLGVAALLDPPRVAFGALPAVIALAFGWLVVIVLRLVAFPLAHHLHIPLDERSLRWLLLLALMGFALRYGGKIYPQSMWGDIGFHANRFAEVAAGRVLLLSRNRGVDFPYPPALYLLLAPFSLLGIDRRELLRFAGALLDALSPFLVYTIATKALGSRERVLSHHSNALLAPWPVVAAALYSLSAATFMTTWWNFSTHIFTQFAHLLLVTALILVVPAMLVRQSSPNSWREAVHWPMVMGLITLQSLVFLGHFGFWMNTSLLAASGLAVLLVAAWRNRAPWSAFWTLAVAFVGAELLAVGWFYSAYTGLFIQQAIATQQGGLTGMAGRAPAPFDALWRTLWNAGFRVHFGFFPVPLALLGLALWWRRVPEPGHTQSIDYARWAVTVTLATTTVLVASGFAALPFLTGSTLSTRWLMFSAWVVALAAVFFVRETWRWGLPARLAYTLMAAYVLWVTATLWLNALAYRIRPPEPF